MTARAARRAFGPLRLRSLRGPPPPAPPHRSRGSQGLRPRFAGARYAAAAAPAPTAPSPVPLCGPASSAPRGDRCPPRGPLRIVVATVPPRPPDGDHGFTEAPVGVYGIGRRVVSPPSLKKQAAYRGGFAAAHSAVAPSPCSGAQRVSRPHSQMVGGHRRAGGRRMNAPCPHPLLYAGPGRRRRSGFGWLLFSGRRRPFLRTGSPAP